jgi:hypothetical protein
VLVDVRALEASGSGLFDFAGRDRRLLESGPPETRYYRPLQSVSWRQCG